jgi:hypothetical protein
MIKLDVKTKAIAEKTMIIDIILDLLIATCSDLKFIGYYKKVLHIVSSNAKYEKSTRKSY